MSIAFRSPLIGFATSCDNRKFAGGRPCVQDTTLAEFFYYPDAYPDVSIEDNNSAVTVDGEGVVFSAFKLSEDESGAILRIFNVKEEATEVTVNAKGRIFATRMDEISRKFLGCDKVTLSLCSKEILTLFIQ